MSCITAALTGGDTTILGKAFGTLSRLPMICGLSNNLPPPPPPWTVMGATHQKRLETFQSVWTSTLFGGRRNLRKAIFTIVMNRQSLTNSQP